MTLCVLLALASQGAFAEKTFPIGKEINAVITACKTLEAATEVANAYGKSIDDGDQMFLAFLSLNICGVGNTPVTFTRLAYETKGDTKIYVYETDVGGTTFWTFTDWHAESI